MSEEYEVERSVAREEAIATMQAVVDGVASGTLRFESVDGDPIDVEVPDVVELEIELELEDDETSVEVELEWDDDRETLDEESQLDEESHSEESQLEESQPTADSPPAEGGEPGARGESEAVGGSPDDSLGGTIEGAPLGPAEETTSLARFEVFRDRADEYRWRLVHHNGNVIATSGEGYTSKQNALKGMHSVMSNAPEAAVEDESNR